jgi:hypothetical protein
LFLSSAALSIVTMRFSLPSPQGVSLRDGRYLGVRTPDRPLLLRASTRHELADA